MHVIPIPIPTLNDSAGDFDWLFRLWDRLNGFGLEVQFNFSGCRFLRPNAVAFLGGLARRIENSLGTVQFDWASMSGAVRTNLEQNGFVQAFGGPIEPWRGHSIPYREDGADDRAAFSDYLQNQWLGRGWVNIGPRLADMIAGRVMEIYANAFEHAASPVGVFSCGQHFYTNRELKLAIVDFGLGIPPKVRLHCQRSDSRAEHLSGRACLHWAFQPGHSTSTKPGLNRGNGLDILRDFVVKNKGRLEVFSHEGYALFSPDNEQYETRRTYFEGTLFNITLRCDENVYYCLSDKIPSGPLF